MFTLLGMPFISKSTYYNYQKNYLFPTIDMHYKKDYENNIANLQGKALCISGDGQCDSPGHCAKYETYSMIEEDSNKIIECQTVQVSETTSSVAMEKKAFERCLINVHGNGLKIGIIATDRHVGVRSLMAKNYPKIRHQFDIWHYSKSLCKKLKALSQKKNCKELACWVQSIVNHLWTCCCNCRGNVDVLRESWNSLLHHVVNEHSWPEGDSIHSCGHPTLQENEPRTRPWLCKDTAVFRELHNVIMSKQLQKDLAHLAEFCHTGNIEVFHNMVLKYRPKRIHFSMDGMVARTRLAVLAHNNNVEKSRSTVQKESTGSGEKGEERYQPYFSKRSQTWHVKAIYENNSIEHVYPMMADVLRLVAGELYCTWESQSSRLPKNVARVPRPPTKELVNKHCSRFVTCENSK